MVESSLPLSVPHRRSAPSYYYIMLTHRTFRSEIKSDANEMNRLLSVLGKLYEFPVVISHSNN